MTAYAYLRKSSVHDPAREVSYEVQESAVREMAARHGDEDGLVILSDWDRSGRLGADKRPGYATLLEAIRSGQASAVYSYSLSRLARSVVELSRLIADCNDRGIPVRLLVDHVDTSTASGKLLTHVLSAVAQFEADVASERARASNAAKLARGESIRTVKFYGEREGDDVDAVLRAFREAGSFSGAAKLLNERGVKPRNSRRGWWPSAVAVVVKRLQPTEVRASSRGAKAGGSDFILAGLLYCPTCGTRLTGTRDRDGRRVRYSCRMGTSLPHQRISVTESHILPAIRAEAEHLGIVGDEEMTAAGDNAKRGELEARRLRILDMFESGDIDRAEKERRLRAVLDALADLDERELLQAVPAFDWEALEAEPKALNAALRGIFRSITIDRATFQPVAYDWRVPEWRRP